MIKALYPGTFDPITLGHLDVIRRASRMFDKVVVGVGDNPEKKPLFSLAERAEMVRRETRGITNVEVRVFSGLMVDFARAEKVSLILRGIRTVSDLEYEMQMAFTNRRCTGLETLFIPPSPEHAFINARFIKEISRGGGTVPGMVSAGVQTELLRKERGNSARLKRMNSRRKK